MTTPNPSHQQDTDILPAMAEDSLPRFSLGGFTPIRRLGAGAMGVAYLARQEGMNRLVVVKVTPPLQDPTELARVQQEVQAVGRLSHPNIVAGIHTNVATARLGQPLEFVMEYVPGLTLADFLKHSRRLTGRATAQIGVQVLEALNHAHQRGIVHRDVKPGNIMLTPEGRVKVLDFGLARDVTQDQRLTATDKTLGTPLYMAPEQLQDSHATSPQSDLYSVGIMLFELLTGEPPLRGKTATGTAVLHLGEERPDLARKLTEATINQLTMLAAPPSASPDDLQLHQKLNQLIQGVAVRAGNATVAPELVSLVQRMIARDRNDRPTIAESIQTLKVLAKGKGHAPGMGQSTQNAPRPLAAPASATAAKAFDSLLDPSAPPQAPRAGKTSTALGKSWQTRLAKTLGIAGLTGLFGISGAVWWSNGSENRPSIPDVFPPAVVAKTDDPKISLPALEKVEGTPTATTTTTVGSIEPKVIQPASGVASANPKATPPAGSEKSLLERARETSLLSTTGDWIPKGEGRAPLSELRRDQRYSVSQDTSIILRSMIYVELEAINYQAAEKKTNPSFSDERQRLVADVNVLFPSVELAMGYIIVNGQPSSPYNRQVAYRVISPSLRIGAFTLGKGDFLPSDVLHYQSFMLVQDAMHPGKAIFFVPSLQKGGGLYTAEVDGVSIGEKENHLILPANSELKFNLASPAMKRSYDDYGKQLADGFDVPSLIDSLDQR